MSSFSHWYNSIFHTLHAPRPPWRIHNPRAQPRPPRASFFPGSPSPSSRVTWLGAEVSYGVKASKPGYSITRHQASPGRIYLNNQAVKLSRRKQQKLVSFLPLREILIKFLIINSWGRYEEMLWNPTNVSSHKKTHITIILYVEIRSSWGKYEELAQYLARNIPREVLGQILAQIFPHKESKTYEEYSSREMI